MKSKIVSELRRIAETNNGLLLPEEVVEAARPKTSPLHKSFEWRDGKAAHAYRIWQARQLIRVVVEEIPGISGKHEVFVSLTADRKDGGYRVMTEVLSEKQMREQMLADALSELRIFQRKYSRLKELCAVFSAIRKVKHKSA